MSNNHTLTYEEFVPVFEKIFHEIIIGTTPIEKENYQRSPRFNNEDFEIEFDIKGKYIEQVSVRLLYKPVIKACWWRGIKAKPERFTGWLTCDIPRKRTYQNIFQSYLSTLDGEATKALAAERQREIDYILNGGLERDRRVR